MTINYKQVNSQAPVTPELATRGVFQLSRLSFSSFSKTVKKYIPQIEYCGFFEIVHFYARRLVSSQNAFVNFILPFYLLWFLLVRNFRRLSQFISVQSLKNKFQNIKLINIIVKLTIIVIQN